MPSRNPKNEPSDSTRPFAYSRAEWLRIVSHFGLTPRQAETLGLAILGHMDKEIAKHLKITVRTVRRYVEDCQERLGEPRRTAFGHATTVAFRKLYRV
jgi:DNA-binding NarL/FixJ family response regulator